MDAYTLSYLLRYIPIILLAGTVCLLLFDSLGELRWDMRKNVHPFSGFFLMGVNSKNEAYQTKSLPLFHTTLVGTARSCDICLTGTGISKKHAIIYFYEGDWFIRSASGKNIVTLNGVRIRHAIPLENKDILGIGDVKLLFVSEKESADEAFVSFSEHEKIEPYPKEKTRMKRGFSLLFSNLFSVFTMILILLFIPKEFERTISLILIFYGVFLLISNIYYLILPKLMKNLDKTLLILLIQLSSIGFLFQIRLELFPGVSTKYTLDELMMNLTSQGISYLGAFLLFPVIALIVSKTYFIEKIWSICAVLTPAFLLITLLFGRGAESHGAGLWLSIGGFSLQLTEFAKITYLIVLSAFFKNRATRKNQFIFAIWAAVVFGLIFLLPDLGSAMILLPTTIIIYMVMTSEYLTTFLILLTGSGMGVLSYSLFSHVRRRIDGWGLLWSEINDNNSQIVYGLQAVGRGGLLGRGIGNGSPGGIPLAASDMIFSVICEELGLLSGICIVLLFIILWLRSAKITILSKDGYSSSLALGIGTLFFVQAAVVIAGTTGIIPLTGATIPFIARGGSSVITVIFLLGILLGLSARKAKVTS